MPGLQELSLLRSPFLVPTTQEGRSALQGLPLTVLRTGAYSIPADCTDLPLPPTLEELDMEGQQHATALAEHCIADLTRLTRLALANGAVTSASLQHLSQLARLEELDVQNGTFDSVAPLSTLRSLTYLALGEDSRGALPEGLASLTGLRGLDLGPCRRAGFEALCDDAMDMLPAVQVNHC